MAGRRYNGRQLIVNDDMSYQESFFDKRDIKQLIQLGFIIPLRLNAKL